MGLFEVAAALITLAAVFSYLNYTLSKLPPAIGLMALSLAGSLLLVLARVGSSRGWTTRHAAAVVARIDLNQALLHGMLGFMLFAGALHINLNELARQVGRHCSCPRSASLLSTAVVGLLTWGLLPSLGLDRPARSTACCSGP